MKGPNKHRALHVPRCCPCHDFLVHASVTWLHIEVDDRQVGVAPLGYLHLACSTPQWWLSDLYWAALPFILMLVLAFTSCHNSPFVPSSALPLELPRSGYRPGTQRNTIHFRGTKKTQLRTSKDRGMEIGEQPLPSPCALDGMDGGPSTLCLCTGFDQVYKA